MVRVGCETDYVYLHGAIGISKTTLQAPVKLRQKRQNRILVSSKVLDTLSGYSDYDHKRYGVRLMRSHSNPSQARNQMTLSVIHDRVELETGLVSWRGARR